MDTVDNFRARYARTSDDDLLAILAVDPHSLTPEARQALGEEIIRRGLRGPGTEELAQATYVGPVTGTPVMRYAKASIGGRLLAYIVDTVIGLAPIVGAGIYGYMSSLSPSRGAGISFIIIIAALVWAIYYTFTKDGREGGQSIGKEMVNLMVVNVNTNQPCSRGDSALRALILFLLQLIPAVGWLIEPMVAIFSEDGRRLGDRVANTQVIDSRAYRGGQQRPV